MKFPVNTEILSFLEELGIDVHSIRLEGDLYSMSNTNHLFNSDNSHKKLVVRTDNDSNSQVINRSAEARNSQLVHALGIGPKVCFSAGYKISEYLAATEHYKKDQLNHQVAFCKAITKLHNSDQLFCNLFDPIQMGIDYLVGLKNPNATSELVGLKLRELQKILLDYACRTNPDLVPCQVDLVPENILYSNYDGNCYIIDQEYSGNFYAEWDLAELASECDMTKDDEVNLLAQYFLESGRAVDIIMYYICKALCNLLWSAWALYYEENEGNMIEYFLLRYHKYLDALSNINGGNIFNEET